MATPPMALAPGDRLGPYLIEALLGTGGMGEVYRGRDTRLGREVALKVISSSLVGDPAHRRRFDVEARAASVLNHPCIVTVYDVGDMGGIPWIAMEWVEGRTLRDLIESGPLAIRDAVAIARQLAEGLALAHAKGVVHRDLKPANVMVSAEGRCKILDFGIARHRLPQAEQGAISTAETMASPVGEATRAGTILGTAGYMSPEQAAGHPVDFRSDQFSLGLIAYEMVTGRQAFGRPTAVESLVAVIRDEPMPIASLRPDVPEPLERLIAACLAKRPEDRFESTRRIADVLETLEAGSAAPRVVNRDVGPMVGPAPSSPPMAADRPSIAVLPFDNLSGDREQEYFTDGIVQEIITGLSRIKWLLVISRNSTFVYKGKPFDVKTVGRELGVRYVLEGSVRRSGDHVRVSGELIETETAAHVWADRFDGTLGDIFTLQDEMTMSVIGAVEPTLRRAEVERARRKRPENLDAYDLFLRALPFAATAMPEDADKALPLLEAALRLEPDYGVVHGFIAWCHEQRYLRAGLNAETREEACRHAHAAIEAGGDDAMALAMGGFVVGILERNYEVALEALDRSIVLSPSSALAFGFSSIIRVLMGDDATAIDHARIGIRLSPYDPLIYLPYIGLAYAHFFTGNFVEAASAASRASASNSRFSVPRYLYIAAMVRLGRLDEARAMAKVLLELQPGFTVSGLVSGNITTPERMGVLASALLRADVPE